MFGGEEVEMLRGGGRRLYFTSNGETKRWAVSGLKDTKPPTTGINWREEKRA